MRILVYGAGVQGCELAHRLAQNEKNTVTLLARGEWKERIDQKGLTIRHWAQLKTTVDRVPTIETLAPEESYDIVFVTVQAGQLPEILPVLKQNKSEFFVFVGNQPHARSVLQAMQRPADKIAFGFQNNGGRRENGQVISVHAGIGMTVGGATAPLSGTFRQRLQAAFAGVKYKLTFYSDMDEWLKCHLALILPVCCLLRLQWRPDQGHRRAAQAHARRGVGGLHDAQGGRRPGKRRGEHQLLRGLHPRPQKDGQNDADDDENAAGPPVCQRPRHACRGRDALPR